MAPPKGLATLSANITRGRKTNRKDSESEKEDEEDRTLTAMEGLMAKYYEKTAKDIKKVDKKIDDMRNDIASDIAKLEERINETVGILKDEIDGIKREMKKKNAELEKRIKECEKRDEGEVGKMIERVEEQIKWNDLREANRFILFKGVPYSKGENVNGLVQDILNTIGSKTKVVNAFRLKKKHNDTDKPAQIKVELENSSARNAVLSNLGNMGKFEELQKIHVAKNVPLFQRLEHEKLSKKLYDMRKKGEKGRIVNRGLALILQVKKDGTFKDV